MRAITILIGTLRTFMAPHKLRYSGVLCKSCDLPRYFKIKVLPAGHHYIASWNPFQKPRSEVLELVHYSGFHLRGKIALPLISKACFRTQI